MACKLRKKHFLILITTLFLTLGGSIYVGFRSENILLIKFLKYIGLSDYVLVFRDICSNIDLPKWILYNLPDGLWLTAYLITINAIWDNKNLYVYNIFIYTMPILAITTEILQYANLLHGTFDYLDLLSYIIPSLILTPLKNEILHQNSRH